MTSIAQRIAAELNVRLPQVDAAIGLLDDKATVPFIARYRKETTGNLDEVQIRDIEDKLSYFRDLVARRETILASIAEQGKLRIGDPVSKYLDGYDTLPVISKFNAADATYETRPARTVMTIKPPGRTSRASRRPPDN